MIKLGDALYFRGSTKCLYLLPDYIHIYLTMYKFECRAYLHVPGKSSHKNNLTESV